MKTLVFNTQHINARNMDYNSDKFMQQQIQLLANNYNQTTKFLIMPT
jgi:hypothetical protein